MQINRDFWHQLTYCISDDNKGLEKKNISPNTDTLNTFSPQKTWHLQLSASALTLACINNREISVSAKSLLYTLSNFVITIMTTTLIRLSSCVLVTPLGHCWPGRSVDGIQYVCEEGCWLVYSEGCEQYFTETHHFLLYRIPWHICRQHAKMTLKCNQAVEGTRLKK